MTYSLFGPIDRNSPGYISRSVEQEAMQSIIRRQFINLIGGRQTGKTTTLFSLRNSLTERGCVTAYIDLSPLSEGEIDTTRWYNQFANVIHTSINPADVQDRFSGTLNSHSDLLLYIIELVRCAKPQVPVVILIDEVTAVPKRYRLNNPG